MTSAEGVSANMHRLGESFVEKVSDVRRRATVDGQAAAPGESLEFLAHIRGWQSEARKQRRDTLLQLTDIGLRVALTGAAGADIFFIPEIHFAGETPELDDEGWWYQVRAVIWCRECRKCRFRKEQEGFQRNEWNKEQLAICARCVNGTESKRASARTTRKVRKRINNTPNPRARRPRAAQGQGVAARDVTSESEEDEEEGVEWGKRMYGVLPRGATISHSVSPLEFQRILARMASRKACGGRRAGGDPETHPGAISGESQTPDKHGFCVRI